MEATTVWRPFGYFEPCFNSRGRVQCAVDFFGRLRRDGDGGALKGRYRIFEPISARNTASGIYENGFFHGAARYSRKHDANGRLLKHVYNPRPLFGTAKHDSSRAIRPLQIPIGIVKPGLWKKLGAPGVLGSSTAWAEPAL